MARIETDEHGNKYIANNWTAVDIQNAAQRLGLKPLSPNGLELVMEIVVDGFDAGIGVNWEVIELAISMIWETEA